MKQLCPKCNGQGIVSRPPWLPGDVHTWTSESIVSHTCNLCGGKMVIDVEPVTSLPVGDGLNNAHDVYCQCAGCSY